jgi:hypothetical protein
MGFFHSVFAAVAAPVAAVAHAVAPAVVAPISSTISSVNNLAHGRVSAAVGDSLSGTADALKPVTTYAGAFGNTFLNFGKGAAHGTSSLVQGDWKGFGQGAARAGTSTFSASGENTVDRLNGDADGTFSPTGYGSISAGNTDAASYRRALYTTAAIAAGAAAGSAFGGAADAGSGTADVGADVGTTAAETGADAVPDGLFGSGITAEQAAGVVLAGVGAATAKGRSPAGLTESASNVTGSTPLTQQEKLILGGGFATALWFVLRR